MGCMYVVHTYVPGRFAESSSALFSCTTPSLRPLRVLRVLRVLGPVTSKYYLTYMSGDGRENHV